MVILSRLNAIFGIAVCTGFLCLQEFAKKGIVLKNFATQVSMKDNQDASSQSLAKKDSKIEQMKRKLEKSKQKIQQVKQKGNGSIFKGLIEVYKYRSKLKEASLQQQVPQKKAVQILNEKYAKYKTAILQMKQQGKGSYIQGFKNLYKSYMQTPQSSPLLQPSPSNGTTAQASPKPSWYSRWYQLYKKSSDSKNQKLIPNHLMFGCIALGGSILIPRTYLLLTLAYFTVYQMYFFRETISHMKDREQLVRELQGIRFVKVWEGFMIAGVGIFGLGLLKILKAVK